LQDIARQFHTAGLLVANEIPVTNRNAITEQLAPDVMSSDLVNHFPEYVSAKQSLISKIVTHDKDFEDAIVVTKRESNFSDISWFTKGNLAITFLQQCTGVSSGFILNSSPGGYSFSHFGAGQGISGPVPVTVPADLLGAYRKYKRFRPSQELQTQCNSLRDSSHYIANSAQDLSKQALLLAQKMTLQGDCDFIKLD
jgi:hypothetical protein